MTSEKQDTQPGRFCPTDHRIPPEAFSGDATDSHIAAALQVSQATVSKMRYSAALCKLHDEALITLQEDDECLRVGQVDSRCVFLL